MNIKIKLVFLTLFLLSNTACFSQATEEKTIHFDQIEIPPLSLDCKTKWKIEKKRTVTYKFVTHHILKKFDTSLGSRLGLSGIHRTFLNFIIDEKGKVCEIEAKSSHEELEKEGIKAISKLPDFTPGYQGNIPVRTYFETSVTFRIDD